MLQEAYIATIWTETGINPDCWHMEENWNRHVHRFCKVWGRGSLSHKIFTINIFFKKNTKKEKKMRKSHIMNTLNRGCGGGGWGGGGIYL